MVCNFVIIIAIIEIVFLIYLEKNPTGYKKIIDACRALYSKCLEKNPFFEKERKHLKKIKEIIGKRLDYRFEDLKIDDEKLSEKLKSLILNDEKDYKETARKISYELPKINFYKYIKDKNKKELISLNKKYKKQIISVDLLNVDFSKAYSEFLITVTLCVSISSLLISIFSNHHIFLNVFLFVYILIILLFSLYLNKKMNIIKNIII